MNIEEIKKEKPQEGLEQFVDEFLQDRLDELDSLYNFLENGELKPLEECAHKWKGFSSPYGFHYLEKLSQRLESEVKNGDLDLCKSLLNQVQKYLEVKKGIIE